MLASWRRHAAWIASATLKDESSPKARCSVRWCMSSTSKHMCSLQMSPIGHDACISARSWYVGRKHVWPMRSKIAVRERNVMPGGAARMPVQEGVTNRLGAAPLWLCVVHDRQQWQVFGKKWEAQCFGHVVSLRLGAAVSWCSQQLCVRMSWRQNVEQ